MSAEPPMVRVTTRPNPSEPGAVLLSFTEDCPYCGGRHEHGNTRPETDADGTYGTRVPHCSDHTHAVRPDGRRAKVTDRNICPNDHPLYVLLPADKREAAFRAGGDRWTWRLGDPEHDIADCLRLWGTCDAPTHSASPGAV